MNSGEREIKEQMGEETEGINRIQKEWLQRSMSVTPSHPEALYDHYQSRRLLGASWNPVHMIDG